MAETGADTFGDKTEVRIMFAAAVTCLAAFAVILYSLLAGLIAEFGLGSAVALLFVLPAFVLLYDSTRKRNPRLQRVDTAALLVLLAGEIAADVGGRYTLAGGGSMSRHLALEATLYGLFWAGYLAFRRKVSAASRPR